MMLSLVLLWTPRGPATVTYSGAFIVTWFPDEEGLVPHGNSPRSHHFFAQAISLNMANASEKFSISSKMMASSLYTRR